MLDSLLVELVYLALLLLIVIFCCFSFFNVFQCRYTRLELCTGDPLVG